MGANASALRAPSRDGFTLPDGSSVDREGDEVAIRDPAGRIVVRYEGGVATIVAPDGDLRLEAPRGDIRLVAGRDVVVEADGVLRQVAGEIEVRARVARAALGVGLLAARTLETTASRLAQRAELLDVEADRIVERSREALQEVREVAQQRLGRLATLVEDVCSLHARRTVVTSTEETEIDGKRVLLG
jgi:hypothetical protein